MQLLAACLAGLAPSLSADFAPVPANTRKRKPLSLIRSLRATLPCALPLPKESFLWVQD